MEDSQSSPSPTDFLWKVYGQWPEINLRESNANKITYVVGLTKDQCRLALGDNLLPKTLQQSVSTQ